MPSDLDVHGAAGKLITGKLPGTTLDTASEMAIGGGIMSGVTLFKENAVDLNQLVDLVAQTRAAGGKDFIVTVDQEGGAVQRFQDVLTPMPSAMAMAAMNHDGRVTDLVNIASQQLHWLGVNCNLAPVLDVNSNPMNPIIGTRSFGDNPDRIAHLGQLVAKAHLTNHVLPVGKHFPGHGDTQEDSHLSLAVCNADRALLAQRELKPFAECAFRLPAMLVGHIWLPAYDEQPLPASLSYNISTQLLRQELKFDGYLFTDDLPVMKAIVDNWGLEEAAVMAVNAGCDNLLVSGSIEQIVDVHRALMRAIESGTIKEDRVQEAIARRQKALALIGSGATYSGDSRQWLADSVQQSRHNALQASLAAIAARSGKNPNLRTYKHVLVLAPEHPRYKLDLCAHLRRSSALADVHIEELRYSLDPNAAEIEKVAAAAAGKDCLLLTFRALLNRGQLKLASSLTQLAKANLVVATDVPYELKEMSKWNNAFATFDPSDLAMEALAQLLAEGSKLRGKFPVVMTQAQSLRL